MLTWHYPLFTLLFLVFHTWRNRNKNCILHKKSFHALFSYEPKTLFGVVPLLLNVVSTISFLWYRRVYDTKYAFFRVPFGWSKTISKEAHFPSVHRPLMPFIYILYIFIVGEMNIGKWCLLWDHQSSSISVSIRWNSIANSRPKTLILKA